MKKIIITEQQLKNIILEQNIKETKNFKPSEEFDKKYGTSLSQTYNFPFDLSEDEIWLDLLYCINKNKCYSFDRIVNKLDTFHFPYPNVKNLPYSVKRDILLGMVSRLNYDDIVWFSIERNLGSTEKSIKIKNELIDFLKKHENFNIYSDLQWVISDKTFEKIKEQMGVLSETKIKKLIREELLGYINSANRWNNAKIAMIKFEVYQQPKSIKRMEPDIRGIIRSDGELFVVNDSKNIIHDNLRVYLHNKGLIEYYGNIFVMRDGLTNNFYLSESYFDEDSLEAIFDYKFGSKETYNKILDIIKKCKEKNPQYNFIPRNIHYKDANLLDVLNEYTH